MKKIAGLLLCALCLAVWSAESENGEIDGGFAKVGKNGKLLLWRPQATDGSYSLTPGEKGGNVLRLDSGTDYYILNSGVVFPVTLSDEITVKLRASGRGKLIFGPIWTTAKSAFLANGFRSVELSGEKKEYSATFRVGTLFLKGARKFVVCVGVQKGSSASVEDMKLSIGRKEAR